MMTPNRMPWDFNWESEAAAGWVLLKWEEKLHFNAFNVLIWTYLRKKRELELCFLKIPLWVCFPFHSWIGIQCLAQGTLQGSSCLLTQIHPTSSVWIAVSKNHSSCLMPSCGFVLCRSYKGLISTHRNTTRKKAWTSSTHTHAHTAPKNPRKRLGWTQHSEPLKANQSWW